MIKEYIRYQLAKFLPRPATEPRIIPREVTLNGVTLKLYDYDTSFALLAVYRELKKDCYGINHIPFKENDVVIDIGGHVGFFSLYLAKRFPFVTIYTFEPTPHNYRNLVENIKVNGVKNITPFNKAVTRDGRTLDMLVHPSNTGGASGQQKDLHLPEHEFFSSESTTLDGIFREQSIDTCKLLKIDCEGSEHEILLNTNVLSRIDYLAGEFHINDFLANEGYSLERLRVHCELFIDSSHMKITECRMAE